MNIFLSTLTLPGTLIDGSNPLPLFRNREKDQPVVSDGSLSEENMEKMGYEIGLRVLPYNVQDRYTRDKKTTELKTIVIENENLRAIFLCEYGGRLYSLTDIKTGKELLFTNPVLQMANLSTRNAWFSGGIEWNVSQYGHSLQTCEPMYFAKVKDEDGQYFLRMYEFERTKRVYYQIDFRLPKNSKNLYAYVKIINNDDYSKSTYWWTNIAVRQEKNLRVFSSTDDIMYIYPESVGTNADKKFGACKVTEIPGLEDPSYPLNFPYSSEYFFQNKKDVISPWEVASYDDGYMFIERSTNAIRFKKMFCWGNLRGGNKWQKFLSTDDAGEYVEVQAGLAPTQVNGFDIEANSTIDFIQAFTFDNIDKDIEKVFDKNYQKSREYVENIVDKNIDESHLDNLLPIFKKESESSVSEIISVGSGWGSLENIRKENENEKPLPFKDSMVFPISSIDTKCLPWINLFNEGYINELGSDEIPLSWMTDINFERILENSIKNKDNINATSLLHLGVMYYERFEEDKALKSWQESISIKPSAIVYRNLSVLYRNKNDINTALDYMKKAFQYYNSNMDQAFIEEYFELLLKAKKYDDVINIYENIINDKQKSEKAVSYCAYAYLEKSDYDKLMSILEREQISIREGENHLLDIYFIYQAKMKAKNENIEYNESLLEKVRLEMLPPENLDFRMVFR